MYKYNDIKQLNFSADEMYHLVKDIEKYPEFLPWCDGLRIKSQNENEIIADMVVGFSSINEKFTSRVNFDDKNKQILVKYEDGPFKSLENKWFFEDFGKSTKVYFDIEFEFKNKFLDLAMAPVFEKVIKKMVFAFEDRAKNIYK